MFGGIVRNQGGMAKEGECAIAEAESHQGRPVNLAVLFRPTGGRLEIAPARRSAWKRGG